MSREFEPYQRIERSIITKYKKEIWNPFTHAVRDYQLIQPGDKIAVCISGGKDSMLMAKLIQQLHRHSEVPFDVVYLVMDPGYKEINRQKDGKRPVLSVRSYAPWSFVQQGTGAGLQ